MIEIPVFKFAVRDDLKDMKSEFLPKKSDPNAAGWDVRCAQEDRKPIVLRAGQYARIPLGIRMIPPAGWWVNLRPRSSTFAKKSLHYLVGTLDNNWRGENAFACQYIPDINSLGKDLVLEFGEAIGQIIPVRMEDMMVKCISNEEYDEFCKNETNERGINGWGSSGR